MLLEYWFLLTELENLVTGTLLTFLMNSSIACRPELLYPLRGDSCLGLKLLKSNGAPRAPNIRGTKQNNLVRDLIADISKTPIILQLHH